MKKCKALLVTNDPLWHRFLEDSLRDIKGMTFEVTFADSAEDAFDLISSGLNLNLLLVDYFLPGIKADIFIGRFRSENDRTAIICFSDNPSVRMAVDLMKLGADEVFTKEEIRETGVLGRAICSTFQKTEFKNECTHKRLKNERKEAIQTVIRTIQHELYNPAAIIKLVSYRLKSKKIRSESEYEEDLETVNRAIDRMVLSIQKLNNLMDEVPNGEIAGGKIYSI
jgi:DNA-binding NtrC family response regulator